MVKLAENFFPDITSDHCWQSTENWLIFRILDVAMTDYDKELINCCFNFLPFYAERISQSRYFSSTNQGVSKIHFLNCLRNMLWPLASNWRHVPRQLENLTHKFIDFYTFVSTGVSYLDMLIKGNVPSMNFKLVYQWYWIFITCLLPNTQNLLKSPTTIISRRSFSKILLYLEKRFET